MVMAVPFGRSFGLTGQTRAPRRIHRFSTDEFPARPKSKGYMVVRPKTIAFAIHGPIYRDDLPGLCDRVCATLRAETPEVAFCDVGGIEPDAVTVDALCRLQLAASRRSCQVRLRRASPELLELVGFMGLRDVLPE
jgi:ABC-type transporter Mla MlaB component